MNEEKTYLKACHTPSEIKEIGKNIDLLNNQDVCSYWAIRTIYRDDNHLRINYDDYEIYFGENQKTIKLMESDLYVFPDGLYHMHVEYNSDRNTKNDNHPQIIQFKLKFTNDDFNIIYETPFIKPEFTCGKGSFEMKGTFDSALYSVLYDVKRCLNGVATLCKPWEYKKKT